MDHSDQTPKDAKDVAILKAAFECFSRYGLRRTSMADIAELAGMSRPALYLHYAGKEDIFNALVRVHLARSETEVARVLAAHHAGPTETLLAVFHAIDGDVAEAMLSSPHADEILSADGPHNKEELRRGEARIAAQLAGWIETGVADGRMTLKGLAGDAVQVARTILAAKHGIKAGSRDFSSYRAAEACLAAMFGKALAS